MTTAATSIYVKPTTSPSSPERMRFVERRLRVYLEGLKIPPGISKFIANRRLTKTDQRVAVATLVMEVMITANGSAGIGVMSASATVRQHVLLSREDVIELLHKVRAPWKLLSSEVTTALDDLVEAGLIRQTGILFVVGGSS